MKMKDKKAEQVAAKKRHKDQLKASKRKEPNFERPDPKFSERPTILIVCEGRNTEPSYFNQFRLSSAIVKPIGEGYNTVTLVQRAMELANDRKYDQVWCVFDADPKPDNPNQATNFNHAISMAESKGFGVAYSNEAFEYWIILHFTDHQGGGMPRTIYSTTINRLLKPYGFQYDGKKSKIITEEVFELMMGVDKHTGSQRVQLALKRARRNYNRFDHFNPASEESSTTLFKLVEELLKYV